MLNKNQTITPKRGVSYEWSYNQQTRSRDQQGCEFLLTPFLFKQLTGIKTPDRSIRTFIAYYLIHPLMILVNTEIKHSSFMSRLIWENAVKQSFMPPGYLDGSFRFNKFDNAPFHNRLFTWRMGVLGALELLLLGGFGGQILFSGQQALGDVLPLHMIFILLFPITHVFFLMTFVGTVIFASQLLLIAAPVTTFIIAPIVRGYARVMICLLSFLINYKGWKRDRQIREAQDDYERKYLRHNEHGQYLMGDAPIFKDFVEQGNYINEYHPRDFAKGMVQEDQFIDGYNLWDLTTMPRKLRRRFLRHGMIQGPRKDEKIRAYVQEHMQGLRP